MGGNVVKAYYPTAYGTCGAEGNEANVTWTLDSNGVLTISGTGRMKSWVNFAGGERTPWREAYLNGNDIKTINIIGIENIGDHAFDIYGDHATSVSISDSVIEIGESAFEDCDSLREINIPDSVTKIGKYAFNYCESLERIVIPKNVTVIEYMVFAGCTSLKSVEIPNGVIRIEQGAFSGCINLTEMDIPDTVTEIEMTAFSGTGFTAIPHLPDGITHISDGMFMECQNLMSVEIPESVVSIGGMAFAICPKLEYALFPASASLGDNVFYSVDEEWNETESTTTQLKYEPDGDKRRITEIVLGSGKTSVTVTNEMNVNFVEENERSKVSQEGHTHVSADGVCQICNVETQNDDSVAIDETNFPDPIFRQYVKENFDSNNDGILQNNEILRVNTISVSSKDITDLTGIEHFIELYTLFCENNKLTALDVSNNTKLNTLYCNNNKLTVLDVSKNTKLVMLKCHENNLTSLDLSKNTELGHFDCLGNPYIVSGCMIDPADLPGSFDLSKASNWENVKVTNGKIIGTGTAQYTYDCGNGKTATFSIQFGQHSYKNGVCEVCGEDDPNYIPSCNLTPSKKEITIGDYQIFTLEGYNGQEPPTWEIDETYVDIITTGVDNNQCKVIGKAATDPTIVLTVKLNGNIVGTAVITVVEAYIPPHRHSLVKHDAVNATCTEDGNMEYWECSECKEKFSDENGENAFTGDITVSAKGHDLNHTEAKEPTCTEDGNTEYWECSECKEKFSDENGENIITGDITIPASGHKWETACNGDCHWNVCAVCGFRDNDSIKDHEYDGGIITKPSTCTDEGEVTYTCKDCGYTKTETMQKLSHDIIGELQYDEDCHWEECRNCHVHLHEEAHVWDGGRENHDENVKIYSCEICGAEKTEAIEPRPDVTGSETTESDVTEPEATEPEITKPEETEPEITKPEDTEPEITKPEETEPEITKPEDTEPEITKPEESAFTESTVNEETETPAATTSGNTNDGKNDGNMPTGIIISVIPMITALAAAVASKRRK